MSTSFRYCQITGTKGLARNELVVADRAWEWHQLKAMVLDSVSSPITVGFASVWLTQLTKPAETSLFETQLTHHPATLRSVLPPEPHPLPERCYPRVFASVSHTCRLRQS
jgi:hypothetical protein